MAPGITTIGALKACDAFPTFRMTNPQVASGFNTGALTCIADTCLGADVCVFRHVGWWVRIGRETSRSDQQARKDKANYETKLRPIWGVVFHWGLFSIPPRDASC
jgi:hypothetical protein